MTAAPRRCRSCPHPTWRRISSVFAVPRTSSRLAVSFVNVMRNARSALPLASQNNPGFRHGSWSLKCCNVAIPYPRKGTTWTRADIHPCRSIAAVWLDRL